MHSKMPKRPHEPGGRRFYLLKRETLTGEKFRLTIEMTTRDELYMKRALLLARRGEGWVSPNPMVGAVIVKEERVIGEGYHRRYGGNHAEINAIENLTGSPEGAEVYVTLEPCSHYGKTPPCVDRLIAMKPSRVIVGTADPNPLVAGQGIMALEKRGIKTDVGVLGDECRRLNEKFFTYMETGRPFITLKFAQTIDGRIASSTGDSKWISSEASRKFAHRLRSCHDAVLVGIGTVLQDDPDLRVRLARGRNPFRVVVDASLRMDVSSRVLANQESAKTIVVTAPGSDTVKRERIQAKGIEVVEVEKDNGQIDLKALMDGLGTRGISSVLVEGGASLITSFLRIGLADRLYIVTAPRILGRGIESVGDLGISKIEHSLSLEVDSLTRKDGDIIVSARIVK